MNILNIEIRRSPFNKNYYVTLFAFRWKIAEWMLDDVTEKLNRIK